MLELYMQRIVQRQLPSYLFKHLPGNVRRQLQGDLPDYLQRNLFRQLQNDMQLFE